MAQYEIDEKDRMIYPMGLTRFKGGIHVSVEADAKECSLLLYPGGNDKSRETEPVRIPFPAHLRMGNVWQMTVRGRGLDHFRYALEADERIFADPCGKSFTGHEKWGDLAGAVMPVQTPIREKSFDWEGDQPLRIPYEDSIVYRAHVRGFTKHASSMVQGKGTFRGIVEKIPYLKELGITTLELMPVAEFSEVMMPKHGTENPYGRPEPTGVLNYWGYCEAFAFAPKASYAGIKNDSVYEFKKLVKALHQAGIEIVIEMFFTGEEPASYVLEAVRYWANEYHIDGVHLIGQAPQGLLAQDPYLTDTKIWASHWGEEDIRRQTKKRLGVYSEGYRDDIRRALKGDEDRMRTFADQIKANPPGCAKLNFVTGSNGFTLMDMVSYEQKHNEANGESNRDGTDYNYTWNCGEEGPTKKRRIAVMRRRQMMNALAILFLSQGTPVLQAGDEFGNTQEGNNNAYCQDNEISWLNWRLLKTNSWLFEYTKQLIAFRKAHPVFHQSAELKGNDRLACGHPDISFHGSRAWVPELEVYSRQLGVFYCGLYACHEDGTPDQYIYVAYNMHGDTHIFALPNLPRPLSWHLSINTADGEGDVFYPEGKEIEITTQRQIEVPGHTVQILIGRPGTLNLKNITPVKKRNEKRNQKRNQKRANDEKTLTKDSKTDINGAYEHA